MIPARERLIVALDVPTIAEAQAIVTGLGHSVVFYKIGLELAFAGGLDLARRLIDSGYKVFVDVKLHDIGITVERAAAQLARLGAEFLTVHAYPQTMAAARDGIGDAPTKILAVTVLTSYRDGDLAAAGYEQGVQRLVARRALQAKAARMDGLVLSAEEARVVRETIGPGLHLVTPGIRMADAAPGDQKRVMTPARAVGEGADYLVVGRPITRATDPRAAAQAIVADIERALAS